MPQFYPADSGDVYLWDADRPRPIQPALFTWQSPPVRGTRAAVVRCRDAPPLFSIHCEEFFAAPTIWPKTSTITRSTVGRSLSASEHGVMTRITAISHHTSA